MTTTALHPLTALAYARCAPLQEKLVEALEARGHHVGHRHPATADYPIDGIPVPILLEPSNPCERWAPTDRTWIQVGSMVHGHIWWSIEPGHGWDWDLVVGQIEAFVRQAQRHQNERRKRCQES